MCGLPNFRARVLQNFFFQKHVVHETNFSSRAKKHFYSCRAPRGVVMGCEFEISHCEIFVHEFGIFLFVRCRSRNSFQSRATCLKTLQSCKSFVHEFGKNVAQQKNFYSRRAPRGVANCGSRDFARTWRARDIFSTRAQLF